MFRQTMIKHAELTFGEKIGIGGFGIVYHGTWRHNDIAIKQLLMDKISPESAEEFEKEAQIMAQLHSPNIVQFYGFCMSPTYCLVMQYMPNGSLFSVLKSNQPLDWPLRFRIAIDIAKGVSFLHHEDILHRDIKSLNVLLDENYKAKLTDFGLSKVKAETKSNSMASKTNKDSVGTLAWMAPELFEGPEAVYTSKSDMYSLGITFWELASRKIPFSNALNPNLIPVWVQKGIREVIPKDCPAALAALIEQCWAGVPAQRPDADKVVTLLKDSESTINASLPSIANPSNVNVSPVSVPQYRGNLSSEDSPKPLVFSEKPGKLPQAQAPTPVSPAIPLPKPSPTVNAKELSVFLSLVAEGEQAKAEEMLKKTPDLALMPTDVTDLSSRTFKNITGFQYALWALDWHMWTMIQKYMSDSAIKEQVAGYDKGSWVKSYGVSANWQNLVEALGQQIKLLQAEKRAEASKQWQQTVGGEQRQLPAHVVNEYCHPSRSFNPCPDFTQGATTLPRARQTDEGEWFTASYNGGKLGEKFAVCRGPRPSGTDGGWMDPGTMSTYVTQDREACRALLATRTQQRDQLLARYSSEKRVNMRKG